MLSGFTEKVSGICVCSVVYCHITICINLKARETIIILYEQGHLKEDVENITLFRKKFYQGYVVLVTGGLKKE